MKEKIKLILKRTPSLKAKEIAKKLGCTRREVNQFFDKHKNDFVKDHEFRWKNKTHDTITIQFDSQWINCDLFEISLLRSGAGFDKASSFIFILPAECKFLIEATARFLALCNQLIYRNKTVSIDLTNNSQSLNYLNRAGFFDHLDENVNVLPKRPKVSTAKSHKGNNRSLVEFGAVDPKSKNSDLVSALTDAFIELSSDKYRDPAGTVIAELIDNVKTHSQSHLLGFAALQDYSSFNGRHIQMVISDSGLGIAATLRPSLEEHYPKLKKLSDEDLVKEVMSKGEISKFGAKSGHGLGFYSSRQKASKFNARYSVRQDMFSLEFQFQNGKLMPVKITHDLLRIEGTHICFDFYVD